jgi:hypothetical protein
MDRAINVVALVKEGEKYIFLYDHESVPNVLQTFGRFAGDPELSFSWYDAAVLSQRVRQMSNDSARRPRSELRARPASH